MSIKHLISLFALAFSAATAACSDSPTGVPNPAPDTLDLDSEPAETRNDTTSEEVADGVAVETVDEVADGVDGETADEVADGVAVETADEVADGVAVETVDEVADGVTVETVEEVSDAVDGDTADAGPDEDIPSPCQSDAECDTGICDQGVCVGCDDGITNGDETDTDCGGPDCGACAVGDVCSDDDDCGGRRCLLGTCRSRPASSIVVGRAHACAIVTGGRIACWGDNTHGQCGLAGGAASVAPTLVGDSDFDGFEMIAAGSRHTCAARGAELYCWGDNSRGQVGPATPLAAGLAPTRFVLPPVVDSDSIEDVLHLALGDTHTCAFFYTENIVGNTWGICWGDNRFGQLGNREVSDTPGLRGFPANMSAVDELRAGRNHTCAQGIYASSGNNLTSAMCWGDNVHRQADPDPYLDADVITSPVEVSSRASTYRGVATGGDASCFVRNQRIECWGDLQAFGINTPTHSVSVGSWNDVWKMAINDVALCVLRWDDSVECIGASGGDMALSPTEARSIVGLEGPMLDVQLGYDFACARGQDGTVRCWGDNTYGQLGRAAPSSSSSALGVDL